MRRGRVCSALLLVAFLAGCGGSEHSRPETATADPRNPPSLDEAESTFHPSDYGIESWEPDSRVGEVPSLRGDAEESGVVQGDTLPGFRVQATITGDIDDANLLRDSLSLTLPETRVYIVYHPPYYKIRVGDYLDRFAAGEMLDLLRRRGFPDAWIVPDRVLRNPPPTPAMAPPDLIEPVDTLR